MDPDAPEGLLAFQRLTRSNPRLYDLFMVVGAHEGVTAPEAATMLGLPRETVVSRLKALGHHEPTRRLGRGLELVDKRRREDDRRVRQFFLTEQGRAVYREVCEAIETPESERARIEAEAPRKAAIEPEVVQALRDAILAFSQDRGEIRHSPLTLFLTVAANEGVSRDELADLMGISHGVASRHYEAIGKGINRPSKHPSMELVETKAMPDDHRQKRIYLTEKGQALAARMKQILRGNESL